MPYVPTFTIKINQMIGKRVYQSHGSYADMKKKRPETFSLTVSPVVGTLVSELLREFLERWGSRSSGFSVFVEASGWDFFFSYG